MIWMVVVVSESGQEMAVCDLREEKREGFIDRIGSALMELGWKENYRGWYNEEGAEVYLKLIW